MRKFLPVQGQVRRQDPPRRSVLWKSIPASLIVPSRATIVKTPDFPPQGLPVLQSRPPNGELFKYPQWVYILD